MGIHERRVTDKNQCTSDLASLAGAMAIKNAGLTNDDIDLIVPKLEVDKISGNVWTHTSTGFMVWKNSEWSNSMLNLLWNEPKQFRFEFFHLINVC